MSSNNNNNGNSARNQNVVDWLTSDMSKTIGSILATAIIISYNFAGQQNDIKTALIEMSHKIDINNVMLENRIKVVEEKQERMEKTYEKDMTLILNNKGIIK